MSELENQIERITGLANILQLMIGLVILVLVFPTIGILTKNNFFIVGTFLALMVIMAGIIIRVMIHSGKVEK